MQAFGTHTVEEGKKGRPRVFLEAVGAILFVAFITLCATKLPAILLNTVVETEWTIAYQTTSPVTPEQVARLVELEKRQDLPAHCLPSEGPRLICVVLLPADASEQGRRLQQLRASISTALDLPSSAWLATSVETRSVIFGQPVNGYFFVSLAGFGLVLVLVATTTVWPIQRVASRRGTVSALAWVALSLPVAAACLQWALAPGHREQMVVPSAAVVGVLLLNSLTEELLYRWWAIGRLSPYTGDAIAVLASALLFSIGHEPASLGGFIAYFVAGGLFGFFFAVRRSLAPCIVMHAAFNMIIILSR